MTKRIIKFTQNNQLKLKVFLTAKKINLFKSNEWINIWEKYILINKEEYTNFIEEIWSYDNNIKQFNKILNSLLKYKEKGNVVKKINKNCEIQTTETLTKIWLKYYSELLKSYENLTQNIFTNEEPYTIDTEKVLSRIASNKAIGIDKVSKEWIKIRNNQAELK